MPSRYTVCTHITRAEALKQRPQIVGWPLDTRTKAAELHTFLLRVGAVRAAAITVLESAHPPTCAHLTVRIRGNAGAPANSGFPQASRARAMSYPSAMRAHAPPTPLSRRQGLRSESKCATRLGSAEALRRPARVNLTAHWSPSSAWATGAGYQRGAQKKKRRRGRTAAHMPTASAIRRCFTSTDERTFLFAGISVGILSIFSYFS